MDIFGAFKEAYEEFKHVLLAFIYDKDDQASPVASEVRYFLCNLMYEYTSYLLPTILLLYFFSPFHPIRVNCCVKRNICSCSLLFSGPRGGGLTLLDWFPLS